MESCRSGLSKRPIAQLQTCLLRSTWGWEVSVADTSGVPVWEGGLEVCVFSLENFLWLWVLRMGVGSSHIGVFEAVA